MRYQSDLSMAGERTCTRLLLLLCLGLLVARTTAQDEGKDLYIRKMDFDFDYRLQTFSFH